MRTLHAACVVVTIAIASAATQVPGPMSPEKLRARLFAFADDSMLGRKAGTPGHAKATQYIAAQLDELRRAGLKPLGDSATWMQSVPLGFAQLDSAKMRLAGKKKQTFDMHYYVDFVPMLGVLGFPFAIADKIGLTDIVTGGRLGSAKAIAPSAVRGKAVLFLPPLRPNGQPDYQLWKYSEELSKYKNSAAVIVECLDLMPRSLLARIKLPWLELLNQPKPEVPLPPVIAVSHGAAFVLEGDANQPAQVSFDFSTRRVAAVVPAKNVIAILPGSDATLSREVIVISAHTDDLGVAETFFRAGGDSIFNGADASGTGSIALLAIAEALATSPVRPQRSIVFLWTVGGERGELGSNWFSQHPTLALNRIVAHIDVDRIGHGQAVAIGDACRRNATRLGGRGSAAILYSPASHVDGGGLNDKPEEIDYEQFASATQSLAVLVMDMANGVRRASIGVEPPTGCAR